MTHRKKIALLAADALDPVIARRLREHLGHCPGCQRYWEEIARICHDQAQAGSVPPEVRADAAFHNRIARRIANDQQRSIPDRWAEALSLGLGSWKVAVPGAALILLLVLALFRSPKEGDRSISAPMTGDRSNTEVATRDPAPSLSAYRLALGRSFEDLDALLDKNVVRRPSELEPVTIAALGRVSAEWP